MEGRQTQIVINDSQLIEVNQFYNGINVGRKKIRTPDLLASLFEILEEQEIAEIMLEHSDAIEGGLESFIREKDSLSVLKIFNFFTDRIRYSNDHQLIHDFVSVLFKKFDMSHYDSHVIHELLTDALDRVQRMDDPRTFKNLFLYLLDKTQIVYKAEADLVEAVLYRVLKRVEIDKDVQLVKKLFLTLADLVPERWAEKVLAEISKAGTQPMAQSPILPKNCVLYQELRNGQEVFVLEVEKQQFDVIYHHSPIGKVGHPKLLFEFTVEDLKVKGCRIFAVKDNIVKMSTQLYRYPYSNVYPNFNACWPDIIDMELSGVHQLSTLPHLFLKSPSNDHLFNGKNLREFYLRYLNKEFDDSELENTGLVLKSLYKQ